MALNLEKTVQFSLYSLIYRMFCVQEEMLDNLLTVEQPLPAKCSIYRFGKDAKLSSECLCKQIEIYM